MPGRTRNRADVPAAGARTSPRSLRGGTDGCILRRTRAGAPPPPPSSAPAPGRATSHHRDGLVRRINTRNFHRATRTTPREVNRQIVLNLVREHQPISRAELARRMEVARGVVTPIVNDLLRESLIYEGATGVASRGRKPRLLHIRTQDRLAIAIDVRFRRTYLTMSDFGGREIARESIATPLPPEELADALAERVRGMQQEHARVGSCEGIGLSVPGMVDHATGRVLHAPTLGWSDVDLRELLGARTGLPVHIERDAVACALAQMWSGKSGGTGSESFVYVTIADGVGAGVVLNGQVVRGQHDAAGEFGHVPLNLAGPPCLCGSRGCLEAYTSDSATIARYLGRELPNREAHEELRESGVTISYLIAQARAGDAAAVAALEETARWLGLGLSVIVSALNPALIVVGGEFTGAWDLVEPLVRAGIQERALTRATARTALRWEPEDANQRLRGAAALVMAPVFAAPQVA